jgi:hypothetical protein
MHRAWTNLLLMIVICIAIFIIFIVLRPAEAGTSLTGNVVKASWRWQRIKSFRIKNSPFGGPVALLRRRNS